MKAILRDVAAFMARWAGGFAICFGYDAALGIPFDPLRASIVGSITVFLVGWVMERFYE